ncbi:MAG TPA: DUF951 domain-containing protein [Candidatus Atribacteria bacterium]|nr:DUF951 domain-containing protein [Candidatus Atribacteria bacterium]
MVIRLEIGDVLTLKKAHPCGSKEWKIVRVGVDIGLRCVGCDRFVMVSRRKLEGKIREIYREGQHLKPQESTIEA